MLPARQRLLDLPHEAACLGGRETAIARVTWRMLRISALALVVGHVLVGDAWQSRGKARSVSACTTGGHPFMEPEWFRSNATVLLGLLWMIH